MQKWNIVVLAGGDTAERMISLESGAGVRQALLDGGHHVTMLDPSETPVEQVDWSLYDLAFLALHGRYGEDGQIQRVLEKLGVVYTGSGPLASERSFHKALAKRVMIENQIPTPDFQLLTAAEFNASNFQVRLDYPLVIKPEREGSSFGISLIHVEDAFVPAINKALEYDENVLIETAILGDEWTVPMLDSQVLPPIRITTDRVFFDTSAKYVDEQTGYEVVSDFENPTVIILSEIAQRTAAALGTRGLQRVDIRLDEQGHPWVLEMNTIPGMTGHSLVPKSAAALGWSFTELCEKAIQSALR